MIGLFGGGGRHAGVGRELGGPGRASARDLRQQIERVAATNTIVAAGLLAPHMGWAMNGLALWLTSDGGAHWRTITPPHVVAMGDAVARINQVDFVDETHGWISASDLHGRVLFPEGGFRHMEIDRTTDGGRTWHAVIPPGCAECGGSGLSFLDARHGYALAGIYRHAHLYETTDSGAHWKQVSNPPFGGPFVFVDARHAFGVRDDGGACFNTSDAGRTWQRVNLPKPSRYARMPYTIEPPRLFDARHGVVAVRFRDPATHAQSVVVDVTSDGGRTWSARPAPSRADVRNSTWRFSGALPFSAPTFTAWKLFVGRALYSTDDAGRHWSVIRIAYAPKAPGIWDVSFTSRTSGWAIFSVRTGAALVHTTDGGRNWKPLAPPMRKR